MRAPADVAEQAEPERAVQAGRDLGLLDERGGHEVRGAQEPDRHEPVPRRAGNSRVQVTIWYGVEAKINHTSTTNSTYFNIWYRFCA